MTEAGGAPVGNDAPAECVKLVRSLSARNLQLVSSSTYVCVHALYPHMSVPESVIKDCDASNCEVEAVYFLKRKRRAVTKSQCPFLTVCRKTILFVWHMYVFGKATLTSKVVLSIYEWLARMHI